MRGFVVIGLNGILREIRGHQRYSTIKSPRNSLVCQRTEHSRGPHKKISAIAIPVIKTLDDPDTMGRRQRIASIAGKYGEQ
jgi:hypothetical protein